MAHDVVTVHFLRRGECAPDGPYRVKPGHDLFFQGQRAWISSVDCGLGALDCTRQQHARHAGGEVTWTGYTVPFQHCKRRTPRWPVV